MESFSKSYFARLSDVIQNQVHDDYDRGIDLVRATWQNGRQVITLGNGGSAITAMHFIADWSKSIFLEKGKPFRGRTLIDNMGLVMAYANDLSFQDLFVEQLKNIMEPGDLVIAISGSGNSENVIRAVEWANHNGGITLGLSGFDGARLKRIAQHSLWVDCHDMQIVEDVHAVFGHLVVKALAYQP